jgi:hypothetical protein
MDITWVPVQLATICADPIQAIGRESNPSPFTISVLRRNLYSVTVLADTYKTWSEWQESNLHYELPKLGDYHYHTLSNKLVQPRGIEPLSTVLQTAAMTTSAKVA